MNNYLYEYSMILDPGKGHYICLEKSLNKR